MVGIDFTLCLASEDRGKTRVMRDGLWSGQREGGVEPSIGGENTGDSGTDGMLGNPKSPRRHEEAATSSGQAGVEHPLGCGLTSNQ